jgi:hypothetical protein
MKFANRYWWKYKSSKRHNQDGFFSIIIKNTGDKLEHVTLFGFNYNFIQTNFGLGNNISVIRSNSKKHSLATLSIPTLKKYQRLIICTGMEPNVINRLNLKFFSQIQKNKHSKIPFYIRWNECKKYDEERKFNFKSVNNLCRHFPLDGTTRIEFDLLPKARLQLTLGVFDTYRRVINKRRLKTNGSRS